LAEQQLVTADARFQREPKHRALLRFGVHHQIGHSGHHDLETLGDVGGRRLWEHRRGDDLGVSGGEQCGLAGEVAVGGRARHVGLLGRCLDGGSVAFGDEMTGGGDQGVTCSALLTHPPDVFIGR
jgi:hypothetical protein